MRKIGFLIALLGLCSLVWAQAPGVTPGQASDPSKGQVPGNTLVPGGAAASPAPVIAAAPAAHRREPAMMRRVAMVSLPGDPGFNGVAVANGYLVIAHPGASMVDVFNVPKRRLIAQIKDMAGASGIVISDGKVYVANQDSNDIAVISTASWQVERRIKLPQSPEALLVVPSANVLYSGNWHDHSVSAVDLVSGQVIRTAAVDGRPQRLAYDPQQRRLFVTLEDVKQIAVLDPSLQLIKRFPVVGSQPTGLAFDSHANKLYVAVRYAVVALDADTGSELARTDAPAGVDSLWLDDADGTLYAVAGGGTVSVIRTRGGFTNVSEFSTDVYGHTLAYDPETHMLYVPGGREGRSQLVILKRIEPAGSTPQLALR